MHKLTHECYDLDIVLILVGIFVALNNAINGAFMIHVVQPALFCNDFTCLQKYGIHFELR